MGVGDSSEREPLLVTSTSNSQKNDSPTSEIDTKAGSLGEEGIVEQPSRSVEDDVIPEVSPLGRNITWSSAYILIISRVIGSGIFATPGTILQSVGSPGLSLLLWIAGAIIAACGLAVSLEYGCMLPRSGGNKVYLEFTYRRPRFLASILIAIIVIFLGFTSSNCIIFSQYTLFALGINEPSGLLRKGVAVGLLIVVTVIHSVFPKTGMKLQDIFGWLKIGVILFMVFSGIFAVLFRPLEQFTPDMSRQAIWDDLWQDSNWNWGIIATSLFKVFYSYSGLENVNNVLNEVKDPVRTLRSVSLAALLTVYGMYLLVNVAYLLVIPIDEIKGSGELISALFFQRLFGETVGRTVLPLAVSLSAIGNVMVVAFAMARLKQEIARQGLLPFPDWVSSTKPFDSPLGGFLLTFIPSLLVIIVPPSTGAYSFILEVEGYAAQLVSLAVAVGLLLLRVRNPELLRPYTAWKSAVWVKVILGVALVAAPFFPPPEKPAGGIFYATYAIVAIAIIFLGVLLWWLRTIVWPRLKGCDLGEQTQVLDDGTSITKIVYKER